MTTREYYSEAYQPIQNYLFNDNAYVISGQLSHRVAGGKHPGMRVNGPLIPAECLKKRLSAEGD